MIIPPWTQNTNADALSRRSYPIEIAPIQHGYQPDTICKIKRRDPDLSPILDYLVHHALPVNDTKARAVLLQIDYLYLDSDGILCHLWTPGPRKPDCLLTQLVLPNALKHEILINKYDDVTAGHMGINKTFEKSCITIIIHPVCFATLNTGAAHVSTVP